MLNALAIIMAICAIVGEGLLLHASIADKNGLEETQWGFALMCIGMCGIFTAVAEQYAFSDPTLATASATLAVVSILLITIPMCIEAVIGEVHRRKQLATKSL